MGGEGNSRARQSGGGGMAPRTPARPSASMAPSKGRQQAIPTAVANRMARRIAFATGIPTVLGMSSFIASYLAVSKGLLDIPPAVTLVTSGAFFLLGVLGLSYGVLSASWEDAAGSLLGFEQIGVNVSRLRSSFKRPPTAN